MHVWPAPWAPRAQPESNLSSNTPYSVSLTTMTLADPIPTARNGKPSHGEILRILSSNHSLMFVRSRVFKQRAVGITLPPTARPGVEGIRQVVPIIFVVKGRALRCPGVIWGGCKTLHRNHRQRTLLSYIFWHSFTDSLLACEGVPSCTIGDRTSSARLQYP